MPKFNDISLRGKLIINFLVSGGVLIAAILFCLYQLRLVGADTREITTNWLSSIQQSRRNQSAALALPCAQP